ncbi:MAG: GH3 auxin-responsive promoter family protein [Flavobacteriaceae bacterium]|nr:GH3 auxin-responsive promoter family protein [Flavobacteriaceae bacterium]
MVNPFINTVTSWFLKKRIHQIELFIKYPHEVQNEILFRLIKSAQNTFIGRKYNFNSIKNYQDFSKQVPVTNYEDISYLIERSRKGEKNIFWPSEIKWFAKSSGTTNSKSKFIPISNESLEDCHYAANKDLLCLYLSNNENSKLFEGKNLRLGGSKSTYEENGTIYGDLSAILIDNMPIWADFSSTPSKKIALMDDWETKMIAIIEESIKENVTSLAGVPSWMLSLLNKTLEFTNKQSINDVWPNLEVYFHGGVSFSPYINQYKNILNSNSVKYYEIYNASEGFFAVQDKNDSKEMLLMLDYGIFYEFIPMDNYNEENIIGLDKVNTEINYAIVITTNAGLWRYKIGDTIRFTCLNPFRIVVTGRTKHFINVFGEEVIIENSDRVIQKISEKLDLKIIDYTVAPVYMDGKKKGRHQWLIEFSKKTNKLEEITNMIDIFLKQENSDYEAKRYNNISLENPEIIIARKGLFYDWMKNKNKLGGQNKIPRLSNSRKYMEELIILNG